MLNDLPIDQLRSLVTIAETNSFTQAAQQLFRTQPALSLQIKKLEETVGAPVLKRNGRTVSLTDAGEVLIDYARRILALNEEAVARLSVTDTEGKVCIGVLEEVALGPLVDLLTKFGRLCSRVQLELQVDTSSQLAQKIKADSIGLAVANSQYAEAACTPLWQETYVWAYNPSYDLLTNESLPLVLDPIGCPCAIRDLALESLKARGISWRLVFSSYSLMAMQAAVRAGLGIGLIAESALTPDMQIITGDVLPALPPANIALYRSAAANSEAVDTLADFLVAHLQTVPFLEKQEF